MSKIGDKGLEVTEIQKLLSMLGYDLIIDGIFDDKTDRSLKAFQKKMGFKSNGQSNSKTIEALKASQKRTSKEEKNSQTPKNYGELSVKKDYHLESSQYLRQTFDKDKIFIHSTSSGPSASNVIKYWNGNEPRVSTAYVIDGESGQIYESFNPNHWSFHLGIKGTNGSLDKSSIGIELCTWGPLIKKKDKFFNHINEEISIDEVCELEVSFRGHKYFHKYTDQQIISLEKLLEFLISEYNISVQQEFLLSWFDINTELIKKRLPGIWTHSAVRRDKLDCYPDQRLLDILNKLSKKYNS